MRVDDGASSAPFATREPAPSPIVASTQRRGRGPAHPSSVVIITIGLALTIALAAFAQVSSNDAQSRLLNSQLSQVAAALEASIQQLQQPLIAADSIASSTNSPRTFATFVQSEVGGGAPFRSVSLWRVRGQNPRMLVSVGRAAFLSQPRVARAFLTELRPSTQLSVTGIFPGPPRGYGIAEVLPESRNGYVVYAEPALLPASSPVPGLDVALYLGRAVTPDNLMASTMPTHPVGASATSTVPFGSSVITIVATTERPLAGVLSGELPWLIGGVGVLLVLIAVVANERHIRRRELVETLASASERRYDVQRDISSTLQQAMLPDENPTFPGVELATRYVAGTHGLEIGGDWYEAIGIDDDQLFIAVGDVSGRGLQAATTMASLRHSIRAYAIQGDPPEVVLGKLDELLDVERDECFATVLCALIGVAARRVTIASAGHPLPLLIDETGSRFIDLKVSPPIGTGGGARPIPKTLVVAPGAALIAFTDGLVERRDVALDDRFETLRAAAANRKSDSLDEMLAHLLTSLIPRGSDDDVAMLGVRWLR